MMKVVEFASETAKQPKKTLPSVFTRRTGMAFGTASLVVMVILASGNFCGDGGHESEEGDLEDYIKFDTDVLEEARSACCHGGVT
jgi:hypothetical protein